MTDSHAEIMALNQAKKELRKRIKQTLSNVAQDSINRQSTVNTSING
jgi:hypothetical protein